MTNIKRIFRTDIAPTEALSSDNWKAKFEVELTDSEFYEVIRKVKIDGHFTAAGQRYFWGFNPEEAPNHWVFRLDFIHFNFQPGIDYKVGSGGFRALLIQGGNEMISGGWIVEGTMRIKEMDPDNGKVKGQFFNVRTEGGRPDGTVMDPAYARTINFGILDERVREQKR